MAPRLITEGEFRSSRYGQLADQIEGRLSVLIEQAENYIETQIDRVLSKQRYVETPKSGPRELFLDHDPVISVERVEVLNRDGTAVEVAPDQYSVDTRTAVIELFGQPNAITNRYRVTYDAGYETVPPIIKAAAILQTAYFAYQDFEIYGSGDGKEPGIRYIQQEVNKYLEPFKRKKLV